MNTRPTLRLICGSAATLTLAGSAALATPRDRTPPSRPGNLTITATTAWSVSLSWGASSDNSGQFTYYVRCSNGHTVAVPQSQTSVVFTSGFQHRGTYSFTAYAVDAAGNRSHDSNTAGVTLPRDTLAPSAPVVTLSDVGATHAVLSWSSEDDGPFVFYNLYMDGVLVNAGSSATTAVAYLLEPATSYKFTVRARDNGVNWSPMSEPLLVTTDEPDLTDKTPPTPPANLWGGSFSDGSTEFEVYWTASADNADPQELIRYDVYVNGRYVGATVGRTRYNDYGDWGENLVEVFARDSAGNISAPATLLFDIP